VNAFALLAIIGDIKRFSTHKQLVSYVGLNPGLIESGNGKSNKVGIGGRGRGDLRYLLTQAGHAVLRMGNKTKIGKWGMGLFMRKGHRNVAVAAVARKILVQIWHLLSGNPPECLEASASLRIKINRLAKDLGRAVRSELNIGTTLKECEAILLGRMSKPNLNPS
jgi:hypothetical protein